MLSRPDLKVPRRNTQPITAMATVPAGRIYFATDGQAIKIGWSGAPKERLQDLQTAHHQTLRLLGTVPGDTDDELAVQKKFKHLHVRGEWFRSDPELLTYIEEVSKFGFLLGKMTQVRHELEEWAERQPRNRPARTCATSIACCLAHMVQRPGNADLHGSFLMALDQFKKCMAKDAAGRQSSALRGAG